MATIPDKLEQAIEELAWFRDSHPGVSLAMPLLEEAQELLEQVRHIVQRSPDRYEALLNFFGDGEVAK